VRPDLGHPERLKPVDRCTEADRLGDLRRSRLELPGQIGPRRLVGGDRPDHVPATDERRHLLEQRAAAMQHADAGGPVGLVPGPGVEVCVDRLQVDRHLRDRLSAVDDDNGTGGMRPPDHLGNRIDRPDHVRNVDQRNQLWLASEQDIERIEVEVAVIEHRHVRDLGLAVLTEDLPGHDVRVVLHLGEHDQVPTGDIHSPPRVRDEVDRGRGVGGEHGLLRRRSQPRGDPLARTFVQVGGLDGQRIHPAVDRRARLRVVTSHRVDHRLRRL
jgi:hypothetical protein